MVENYTAVHRAFLQSCARNSVFSVPMALNVLASIQSKHGSERAAADEEALETIVNEINAQFSEREIEQRLNFVNFEFDESVGKFLVLCNTLATIGQSPVYNEAECMYMKTLMENIVTSETHSIPFMRAMHLTSVSAQHLSQSQPARSAKKVTQQRAEELIDEWISNGYFFVSSNQEVLTLGPKSITEFRDTLRTKFALHIKNCHLCGELAMKPMICPNVECEIWLHKRCYKDRCSALKQMKCPKCKGDWDDTE